MATTDNKIINGSGLSKLSSQIKSYVNDKTEISVGAVAPTDNKIKLWVDTSAVGGVAWNDITDKPDLSGYATMTEIESKGYQTADQVNTLINQALGVIENGTY